MNKLYEQIGSNYALPKEFSDLQNMIKQFNAFKSSFKGNPQQQVQQLLNSGRITQADYNNAVQMARALQNMLK